MEDRVLLAQGEKLDQEEHQELMVHLDQTEDLEPLAMQDQMDDLDPMDYVAVQGQGEQLEQEDDLE